MRWRPIETLVASLISLAAALVLGIHLSRLAAHTRGVPELAMGAGLEARTVTTSQMTVVLEKVLPEEVTSRGVGVGDADSLLGEVVNALATVASGVQHDSPESVFARLGG